MTSPGGGEPRTIDVPLGLPSSSAVYTLPPGITFDVEAVYVEVSTAGAGDTTAELTLSEQSGVVIARKSQSQVIDAGSTGSATWALRLSDDGGGASPSASQVPQYMTHSGSCAPNNAGLGVFTAQFGPSFFDATPATATPVCVVAGTYTLLYTIQGSGINWPIGSYFIAQSTTNVTTGGGYIYTQTFGPIGAVFSIPTVTLATADNFAVGDTFQMDYFNGDPGAVRTMGGSLLIVAT